MCLAARGRAGEWDEGDVSGAFDGDGQRPLMAGARAELPSRLDLAPFANMPAEPGDVLVVNVPDVVDTERTDLSPWRVPASAGTAPRAAAGTSWTPAIAISIAFAALALRSPEAGAWWPPFPGRPRARAAALSTFTIPIVYHDVCSLAFV